MLYLDPTRYSPLNLVNVWCSLAVPNVLWVDWLLRSLASNDSTVASEKVEWPTYRHHVDDESLLFHYAQNKQKKLTKKNTKLLCKKVHLKLGRFEVDGGRCFFTGGLKSNCWRCGTTIFSVKLCAQHEPNMNESTHMPMWRPSDLMHSHTNMQVPSYVFTKHGFGLIL